MMNTPNCFPAGGASVPASRWRRMALRLSALAVVLITAAYAGSAVMDIPPPSMLFQLGLMDPSRHGDLFPAREIAAPAVPRALLAQPESPPATVPWEAGEIAFDRFLELTHTNAFLILRGGKLTYEWYRPGVDPDTPMSSWSMTKSLVSLLVGQAIDHGKLRESDRLVDLLPELATAGDYGKVTVRDLLDMRSGVFVDESYRVYWPFTGATRMYLTRDLPGFAAQHRQMQFTPGSASEYSSLDTQLLGLALARVTGSNLADLMARDIWQPIGAEQPATWSLDRADGTEKAFCCVNATARDFARVGQMLAEQGSVAGKQVVSRAWVARIATPVTEFSDGWGFSAQWWHRSANDGEDYSSMGLYGQYIYVHPSERVVIVKLSDHGAEDDEYSTYDVFRAIARR